MITAYSASARLTLIGQVNYYVSGTVSSAATAEQIERRGAQKRKVEMAIGEPSEDLKICADYGFRTGISQLFKFRTENIIWLVALFYADRPICILL